MPKWSKDVYKVTFIKDNDYMENNNKRKPYQRHELLKVQNAGYGIIKPKYNRTT